MVSTDEVTICEGAKLFRQSDILDGSIPEPNSGCWLWLGARSPGGYGHIRVAGILWMAHRLSYEAFIGSIPERRELDHKCRVRSCVNPEHLQIVTRGENALLGETGKVTGAMNRAKTHCKRGHPLSGNNLYIYRDGRDCKICRRSRR